MANNDMNVIKRNGTKEEVFFDKILQRVKMIGLKMSPPLLGINYSQLVMKVIDQLYDNIPTKVIDELTAEQCASLCTKHLDYGTLASRIIVSNHHKNTISIFSLAISNLYNFKDVHGNHNPLIDEKIWKFIENNKYELDTMICNERDYYFDYFGFKTLERAYLLKVNKVLIERPQYMWLRVALGIHVPLNSCMVLSDNGMVLSDNGMVLSDNGMVLSYVKETYDLLSQKYFSHATPTLFNAGTPRPQLSSCFLLGVEDDSVDGIYNTLKDCASISKWAGGIGLHIHNIRATGSHIQGTNGTSNGIIPMLRVFNMTARYIDQGGGRRNGSFAIYLEPWHADIQDFLDLKKNHGDEEMRARDLFFALWIPDLFMEKVKTDSDWALFCPHQSPGLSDCYGEEFNNLYERYKSEGKAIKIIKARDLWFKILDSQMETGTPYLLYKDPANAKSNQQNLGVIKSSNLCTEIIEYSDGEQSAVCNLASLGLSKFVLPNKTFDYNKLHEVTKVIVTNLNKIIDVNFYPTKKTKLSNQLHRPIGIGVQGLADTFALMDLPFYCDEAKNINKFIFETIYHASLERSNEIAQERKVGMKIIKYNCHINNEWYLDKEFNNSSYDSEILNLINILNPLKEELDNLTDDHLGCYSSFEGCPASRGILQFDLWSKEVKNDRYDWAFLKENIINHGLRNSLLIAPMPTASTSQILGNNECFEPFTSNIYSRRTNAGEFVVANKYLMAELISLGLWTEELKDSIIKNKGSIQHLEHLSTHLKEKYKIVWEIPMKHIIDMASDRGIYICQSQSLNLWMEDPNYKTLTSMHFYAWKSGLKTGMYYLRRKAKHQAQQFTIKPNQNGLADEISCENCSA
jgi:ribonucleoside-diphosphate reductase alpha chain